MATMMIPSWTPLAPIFIDGFGRYASVTGVSPDGRAWQIRCEYAVSADDLHNGMMKRSSFAPGRNGMLFEHRQLGLYAYWMYQVPIPLDIIWIGAGGRIVEIINAEPCNGPDSCMSYGGHQPAQYVLEIAGGEAQRLGLRIGDQLQW